MAQKVYEFEINQRKFRLSLKEDGTDLFCAEITDRETNKTITKTLDIKRLSSSTAHIIHDGQSFTVTVSNKRKDYEVEIHDKRVKIKHLDKRRPRGLPGVSGPGLAPGGQSELLAPMPGKIIQILKDVGEEVKAGEGLVVLEAMKMENEMRSEADGKITEILVKPGQKVETGAPILKISCQ